MFNKMEIICKEYLNSNLWGLLKIRFIRYHACMRIQIINSLNSLDSFFNANYH